MRYRISKYQVRLLLEGKPLTAGRIKLYADGEVKETLQAINDNDLYDKYDIFIKDRQLEILRKAV